MIIDKITLLTKRRHWYFVSRGKCQYYSIYCCNGITPINLVFLLNIARSGVCVCLYLVKTLWIETPRKAEIYFIHLVNEFINAEKMKILLIYLGFNLDIYFYPSPVGILLYKSGIVATERRKVLATKTYFISIFQPVQLPLV